MYKATQEQQAGSQQPGGDGAQQQPNTGAASGSADNVTDVPYEEVK
jgi:hypothetical protein